MEYIQRHRGRRVESGQTLVEFALLVVLALSTSVLMNRLLMTGVRKFWVTLAKDIAPACPASQGCRIPEAIEDMAQR